MIQLTTSNGDKFEYPLWLKDVTLSKYLNFISLIEPTKPQVLKDIDKILSQMDDLEKDSKEYNEKLLIANDLFDSIGYWFPACKVNASCSAGGSVFPLRFALRSIPSQAFGLK